MEFAIMALAAGFATTVIIVAIRIDHVESMARIRRKYGNDKDNAA